MVYKYTVATLLQLKKTIYALNPEMFDKAAIIVNDAIEYVIKMVPVIAERCSASLELLVESLRMYALKGQGWMQQQFSRFVFDFNFVFDSVLRIIKDSILLTPH